MNYIGEHLLLGKLGHFFIVLSLVASLVAVVAYYKSASTTLTDESTSWKRLGRIAFGINILSVFGTFAVIYYIVSAHLFEYFYAWNHSSQALSVKYLLSCIWEGQEGSFLLWTIWQSVLGGILMFRSGKWEAPVMTVISIAQFCLLTMILGIYIANLKIGNNPFLLVREYFQDAPIFNRPDYLSLAQMKDGQGLNQLLQNYWMVIHPPVLFLGFASSIVPFAFVVAGLWKKDYSGWTKMVLPWSLFCGVVLGLGIMMGAAWAYESLTFGGFWAWDPVENASLVPWLVLIAGIHTHIIFNKTGNSLRVTYLFYLLAFILVVYSTFLTRSGVLGDISVHAFAESGMNWQLLLFLGIFFIPPFILFFINYKKIPHLAKEESSYSREFWMFIGALVLFLSALVITWQTSFNPIYNKLTGRSTAAPEDPEFAYNKIQIFVAIIIGCLTGISQYFKFKNTPAKNFFGKIWLPVLIAAIVMICFSITSGIRYDKQGIGFSIAIYIALFSGVFAVVANAIYIWYGANGKFKSAGASVAHVGFGLMLVGILIAASNKKVLSFNTTGINLKFGEGSKEKSQENLTLVKGVPTDMGDYMATFVNSDSSSHNGTIMHFKILFERKDGKESFILYPNLIQNTKGQEGFSNNPDSRHYWNKDIFTYISYADNMDRREDTAAFKRHIVNVHDTIYYSNGFMVLDSVAINPANDKYQFTAKDTALMAAMTVYAKDGRTYKARPAYYLHDNQIHHILDTVITQSVAVGFEGVSNDRSIVLQVKESSGMTPFVALKVYEFPHINILWLGTLVMATGFVMSIVYRAKKNKKLVAV